ncbi:MAG: hypothetical protein ACFE9L_01475 [Candidatus Hodarchaeota archaeon]
MDSLTEFVLITGTLCFGLFIRLIPYIRYRFPGGYDVFYHLGRIRDPTYPQDAETEEMKYYPSWMHDIYRKITNNFTRISDYQLLRIHTIWDPLNGLFFWIIIRYFYDFNVAFFALILFLFAPYLVKQADTLSPRPVGHFWFNFALFFSFFSIPISFLGIIGIIMTVRCHRLAFQTIVVVFLVLGIFFNPIFLINLILGVLLGLLIYGNNFKMLIKSHYSLILRFARGPHLPNKRYLTPVVVPYTLIVIPIVIEIIWINITNGNFMKKLLNLGFELGKNSSLDIFFTFWIVGVLLLVLFYPFGESLRHIGLLVAPSSVLVSNLLIRLNLEILIIPLFILNLLLIFILLRHSLPNEDLIKIGKYIAKSIDKAVICAPSSRRPIDYYTKTINYTFPTAKITSDELPTIINESGTNFLVIPTKIQIPQTKEVLVLPGWKLVKFEL